MAVTDVRENPDPNLVTAGTVGSRWVDRLDPRLVNALTVVGFGFPVAAVFWLVAHYGVNVIEGDQWDDVTVIRNSYTNLFDWSSLWTQHNENRIFFPNLVVIALSRTTHFNVHAEEYLAALMLVAATALVILTHKRRSPDTPWLYYCPVAFLMLSFCQYGNLLWGFQMAWYLVLVSMAAAFYLVDRISLTWLAFLGALTAAVIGSFSSLQGLLIWPAGLVLLYHRRRAWRYVAPWLVAGVAATALYVHNFNNGESAAPHNAVLHHLMGSAKFYTFAIGDILGIPFQYRTGRQQLDLALRAADHRAGRPRRGRLRDPPTGGEREPGRRGPYLHGSAVRGHGHRGPGDLRVLGGQRLPLHHVRPAGPCRHLPGPAGPSRLVGPSPPVGTIPIPAVFVSTRPVPLVSLSRSNGSDSEWPGSSSPR